MTTPRDSNSSPKPPGGYGPPPGRGAPPPPATPQGWQQPAPGGPSSDDTVWAVLAHLSFFVLSLIAPLVVYLVKKDSPFTRRQAAEAFNFHVTLTLAAIVSAVLMLVLIGFVLIIAVGLWGAVLSVVAAVRSGRGEDYRYPLTIRFLH